MNLRNLTARQKLALKIAGYCLWGLVLTVIFVAMQFPSDRIRQLAEAELSAALGKEVKIEEAAVYRLSGLDLKGLDFYSRKGFTQPLLRLARQRVRAGILSYLRGRTNISLISEPDAGGRMDGQFEIDGENATIALAFDAMRLEPARFEPKNADEPPLEMDFTLDGTVAYSVPTDEAAELGNIGEYLARTPSAESAIDLTFSGVRIANLITGGVALPELRFDTLTFKAGIAEGTLTIAEFKGTGPMGDLDLSGKLRLNEPFKQSGLALQIKFTPSEDTRKEFGPILGLKLRDDGRGTYSGFVVGQAGSPQINR